MQHVRLSFREVIRRVVEVPFVRLTAEVVGLALIKGFDRHVWIHPHTAHSGCSAVCS